MLRAGSLLYALVLSLMVGLLCASIIFIAYFNKIERHGYHAQTAVIANAHSGINYLLALPSSAGFEKQVPLDLYSNGADSVLLARRAWGAYEVVAAQALRGKYTHTKAAITGSSLAANSRVALYLTDRNRPLSLCGKTVVKGACYLPKADVKRAYIEGQNFIGNQLIDGEKRLSEKRLPPVDAAFLRTMEEMLAGNFGDIEKEITLNELRDEGLAHSFVNQPILIREEGAVVLQNEKLAGNIIIASNSYIEVGAGALLEHCLLVAPQIVINRGFTGRLQVFAGQSIVVEEDVQLKYPSFAGLLVVKQPEADQRMGIELQKNAKLSGVVFAAKKAAAGRKEVKLSILEEAEVEGQVYVQGQVELKGKVAGSLYTDKFMLATPSSVYENHLLNASIDFSALSTHYLGMNLVHGGGHKAIIEWVE